MSNRMLNEIHVWPDWPGGYETPWRAAPTAAIASVLCLILSAAVVCAALGDKPRAAAYVTQRGINETAAELERAHRQIVEDAGLRAPREPFLRYCERIAGPLPGETPVRTHQRIAGYARALDRVTRLAAPLRRMPLLRNRTEANLSVWRGVSVRIDSLAPRVQALRPMLISEQTSPGAGGSRTQTGDRLADVLFLMQRARLGLRDALP